MNLRMSAEDEAGEVACSGTRPDIARNIFLVQSLAQSASAQTLHHVLACTLRRIQPTPIKVHLLIDPRLLSTKLISVWSSLA
jgi:hypothetical protein